MDLFFISCRGIYISNREIYVPRLEMYIPRFEIKNIAVKLTILVV